MVLYDDDCVSEMSNDACHQIFCLKLTWSGHGGRRGRDDMAD